MLILTRRVGEKIIIGDTVTVVILGTGKNQVKIGIEAPIEISIDREEIYKKKQDDKNKGGK